MKSHYFMFKSRKLRCSVKYRNSKMHVGMFMPIWGNIKYREFPVSQRETQCFQMLNIEYLTILTIKYSKVDFEVLASQIPLCYLRRYVYLTCEILKLDLHKWNTETLKFHQGWSSFRFLHVECRKLQNSGKKIWAQVFIC